jgi:large subunit ribosomal protein L15
MNLNSIKPAKGSTKNRKRIGRGTGSGRGGTSTRGHKGAKSRSGYSSKPGFEGGQMPLVRRVPKFGFNNPGRIEYKPINLDVLEEISQKTSSSIIDVKVLSENGLMSKNDKIKVLGRGELKSKVEVVAHAFSASAIAAIEKAGGKATIVS